MVVGIYIYIDCIYCVVKSMCCLYCTVMEVSTESVPTTILVLYSHQRPELLCTVPVPCRDSDHPLLT